MNVYLDMVFSETPTGQKHLDQSSDDISLIGLFYICDYDSQRRAWSCSIGTTRLVSESNNSLDL
jgi:hypothetical protein